MAVVDVYGSADAWIVESAPNSNFGSATYFTVGWVTGKTERRAVIRADLSAYVPAGSTNLSAVLHLYASGLTSHVNDAYYGYRVLDTSWAEGTVTWNGPWDGPGCDTVNVDYETADGFGPFDPSVGWNEIPCTAMVQAAWADDKVVDVRLSNSCLVADDEVADTNFNSREGTYPWFIRVTYTPPAAPPSRPRAFVIG